MSKYRVSRGYPDRRETRFARAWGSKWHAQRVGVCKKYLHKYTVMTQKSDFIFCCLFGIINAYWKSGSYNVCTMKNKCLLSIGSQHLFFIVFT